MLNWIWLFLILLSIVYAAFSGQMQAVSAAAFDGAKDAVNLVIGIAGPMIFFLGLMRIAQDGGLLVAIARALRPILRRLFPEVPEDHPAMGAMVMNMASNILGLEPDVDQAEEAMLSIAAGDVDEACTAAWLRERVRFSSGAE